MKIFLLATIALYVIPFVLGSDPKPAHMVTFYVSGLECGSCVYAVQQSVSETQGVSDVTVVQVLDNYANVTFDPKIVTEHQIAQAVREAFPLHGTPYLATLKLRVPHYTKNTAKVETVFAAWKNYVKVESVDTVTGEVLLHFLPLKVDTRKTGPQGWSLAQFTEAAQKQGLQFTLKKETL